MGEGAGAIKNIMGGGIPHPHDGTLLYFHGSGSHQNLPT